MGKRDDLMIKNHIISCDTVYQATKEDEHYNIKHLLKIGAKYNVIFGLRGNGKTFSVLSYIVEQYYKRGEHGHIIRRWDIDLTSNVCKNMFDGIVSSGVLEKITKGKYIDVKYKARSWYMVTEDVDEKGKHVTEETPFCTCSALRQVEHNKGSNNHKVTTVLFDEFIPISGIYLPDEWNSFKNEISTLLRDRTNFKVFLCANTTNRFNNVYFQKMGLCFATTMKKGTIDLYKATNGKKIAVEYTLQHEKSEENKEDQEWPNDTVDMINTGDWDIFRDYPIRDDQFSKIRPKDICFKFFIDYGGYYIECSIINNRGYYYIYARRNGITKPTENDLIYTQKYIPKRNYHRNVLNRATKIDNIITNFFLDDKVFYQDVETGDLVHGFLSWCQQEVVM